MDGKDRGTLDKEYTAGTNGRATARFDFHFKKNGSITTKPKGDYRVELYAPNDDTKLVATITYKVSG